ncbi:MAG: FeoB-associated Cys-rich membrane protein [Bacteroidales bacterium]|nr:FeoB-associated Cys-rich membrane protein [Candidatus Physcocola equi]
MQEIIVAIIGLFALAFAIRKISRFISGKGSGCSCCGQCPGCSKYGEKDCPSKMK